ncbi:uncharacterized protein PV09_00397 [Verruconis gallopava]|uniref:Major facilitator superfamily (MFS) profile domain-containing protein n=1 Tax=Verruconis gallopava TaxID=253628 RepID=A0A0D1Y3M8_9PEZI|nr:uncharacterized protein PV09_00397 [Verruconis gallopava]KIW09521.1 hypothetical protein PV09_00397 [Verruconis gallopava]
MDQDALEHQGTRDRSRGKTVAIVFALCLALFLAALDTVLITTALPSIAKIFNISDSGYAWVGSAYLLTNAASVPFWGKISDIFGRKPILMLANAIFIAGSLISALSNSLCTLIAGRAVQGLGGGGIVILVNICVGDLFSLRERGLIYGIVGAVWATASALGPVLGGAFTEKVSWRWCFWLNLPTDGIAAGVLLLFLDIHNPKTPLVEGLRSIDWLGTITIAGGTIMFLLGLQFGGIEYPWSSSIVICLIIFGVITLGIFFTTQFKLSPSPIMPFSIFGQISNLSALAVCFFDAFVFNSVAYFVPLYFQTVLHATALQAGTWMLALAVPLALFSASAGWIMEKTGRYLELLRGGLFLMTVGLGLCISFPTYISWARIICFLVIIGIGFGPNFHAPLIALQTHLKPEHVGAGTATFGFIRMLAGACGVVLGQVVFQGQMQGHFTSLIAEGVPKSEAERLTKGSAISAAGEKYVGAANNTEWAPAVRQAEAESFSMMWILYTVASAMGLLVSLGIRKAKLSREHTEFKTGIAKDDSKTQTTDVDSYTTAEKPASGNESV